MTNFGMPTLIELSELERSAALCRELGLKFIELNMSFPQNQPELLDTDELRRIAARYGIYYTVHIDENFDPCGFNSAVTEAHIASFLRVIELAKELDIPTLNFHLLPGIYVTLPDRRVYIYQQEERRYLDAMRAFRDRAEKAVGDSGIKLCIENTDGFGSGFLLHAVDLLLESSVFALTFDIGHDHAINGADMPLILARADRLAHMHMHDAKGTRVHLALGDGELDLPSYLKLAEAHGCRIVLETKTIAALRQSALCANKWLNMSCNPEELWDVYDSCRKPLGRLHKRGDELAEGEYHIVVHVWLRDASGRFLLTKRSENKGYAGMWECTGGSALAGEDSLTAALREVQEETGIVLERDSGRRVISYCRDHYFCDVWLFTHETEINALTLQSGETCAAQLADSAQILELRENGMLIPVPYLDDLFDC